MPKDIAAAHPSDIRRRRWRYEGMFSKHEFGHVEWDILLADMVHELQQVTLPGPELVGIKVT